MVSTQHFFAKLSGQLEKYYQPLLIKVVLPFHNYHAGKEFKNYNQAKLIDTNQGHNNYQVPKQTIKGEREHIF